MTGLAPGGNSAQTTQKIIICWWTDMKGDVQPLKWSIWGWCFAFKSSGPAPIYKPILPLERLSTLCFNCILTVFLCPASTSVWAPVGLSASLASKSIASHPTSCSINMSEWKEEFVMPTDNHFCIPTGGTKIHLSQLGPTQPRHWRKRVGSLRTRLRLNPICSWLMVTNWWWCMNIDDNWSDCR